MVEDFGLQFLPNGVIELTRATAEPRSNKKAEVIVLIESSKTGTGERTYKITK